MKTSTEIGSIAAIIGYEKAIEYVAKAGFDCFDFSMFDLVNYDWGTGRVTENDRNPLNGPHYKEFIHQLKQIGLDHGITCNQAHAPFPTTANHMMPYVIKAIECASLMGASIIVVHPDNPSNAEQNKELYMSLLPYAEKYQIKIALENMWSWKAGASNASQAACSHHDDFKKHLDLLNKPSFCACVDIGHAEMKGLDTSAVETIKTLGSYVQALHIHDNDLIHDSHQIPFSMNIDFSPILKALKAINYQGIFTLEADAYLKSKHANQENCFELVKDLFRAARKLANMFESL